MSTDFTLYEDDVREIVLNEHSSIFDLMVFIAGNHVSIRNLSPEQVVDIATKMIQPTLYNVEDPQKFFDEVIMKKIKELFV